MTSENAHSALSRITLPRYPVKLGDPHQLTNQPLIYAVSPCSTKGPNVIVCASPTSQDQPMSWQIVCLDDGILMMLPFHKKKTSPHPTLPHCFPSQALRSLPLPLGSIGLHCVVPSYGTAMGYLSTLCQGGKRDAPCSTPLVPSWRLHEGQGSRNASKRPVNTQVD
jgi:hypothetical protein